MTEELKCCPFCGNQNVKNVAFMPSRRFYFAVLCEPCQIQGPAFYTCTGRSKFPKYEYDEAKKLSAEAWNRRYNWN